MTPASSWNTNVDSFVKWLINLVIFRPTFLALSLLSCYHCDHENPCLIRNLPSSHRAKALYLISYFNIPLVKKKFFPKCHKFSNRISSPIIDIKKPYFPKTLPLEDFVIAVIHSATCSFIFYSPVSCCTSQGCFYFPSSIKTFCTDRFSHGTTFSLFLSALANFFIIYFKRVPTT